MNAYIINLASAVDRREYARKALAPFASFKKVFVEGVDGRALSEGERGTLFDHEKCYRRYGRYARPGEIGCTLSHVKCWNTLLESGDNYALILEDDIIPAAGLDDALKFLVPRIDGDAPRVALLSGGFWYVSAEKPRGPYRLAGVFDAWFTHAYLINRKAAERMRAAGKKPFWVADDWRYIASRGVRVGGLLPHCVDQDWSGAFPSLVSTGAAADNKTRRGNLAFPRRMETYAEGFVRKLLKQAGHYESADS